MPTIKMKKIDGNKLKKLLIDKYGSLTKAGALVGRSASYFQKYCCDDEIPAHAVPVVEKILGIKYDEYKPDDETNKKQPEQMSQQTAPTPTDLTRIEIALKELVKQQTAMAEVLELIKQGFRVQTRPMISSQDIAEGVLEGLKRFNRQAGTEAKKDLNGTIFSAVLSAMNKKDEMNNEQLNRTDGIRTNMVRR